jgi:hypothetical protein
MMQNQETLTQNQQPGGAQAEAAFHYDASAVQRYTFVEVHKDGKGKNKRYPVTYFFGKLDDDALFVEYDRKRNVRMARDGEGDIDNKSNSLLAAGWYGRQILVKVEGWGPEDGSKLSDRQLGSAVLNGPLACAVDRGELELGDADEDAPWENEDTTAGNVYPLRALFSGRELLLEHTLDDADADQDKRWTDLMARTKLKDGERLGKKDIAVPSNVKAIGRLYDSMNPRAEGYKDGRVPLFHKVAVMEDHMGLDQELAEEQEKND